MTISRRILLASAILLLAATESGPRWVTAQEGPPQFRTGRGQTVTVLPDGSRLLIGGEGNPARVAVQDTTTGTMRAIGSLSAPRSWHSATVLPDGSVLIAGGLDAQGRIVAQAERFDPATGTVTVLAEASVTPRAHHTATLLTDGRVLFAGGEASPGGVPAELWDATTNTVLPVPGPPRYARRNGVARMMAGGRVEFSNGTDEGGEPVAVPEYFDPEISSFVYAGSAAPLVDDLPRVAAVIPPDGADAVSPATRIAMRFSTSVDPSSSNGIQLSGPAGPVPASIVIAEHGMLGFVTPHAALDDGEYVVSVVGLKTVGGALLGGSRTTFRVLSTRSPDDPTAAPADWRGDAARAFNSPWRKLPPLTAKPGVTAVAGQVLLLDGEPLQHVTLEIGSRRARTDRTGRFLLELGDTPSRWREMVIDGTTANRPGIEYGVFEVAVQLVGKQTAALPYTIWMPRLDTANRVRIESPTQEEVVITTPHIPGLALHLPKHTVITDRDGKIVREVGITPIPVDRPPFPLPTGIEVPVYFTIQPGGAYLATHNYGPGRKGPSLVYPNYKQDPPGTRADFWHYDPEEKGWYVYGAGQVSADGTRVVPNYNVALYEFTGAMINTGRTPPPNGPVGDASDGDPVDLATGLFVMEKTDLALQDVVPLALTRTYRPGDNANRPFGIGATHPYAMFLWSANQYQEADLVLPTGQRIHYVRISPGNIYSTAVFEHTATPGPFHKSLITWNGDGWDLRLKDGTVYVFGDVKPLQEIRDRFGNTTRLTYDAPNGNITKISSPTGRYIELSYDGLNRITQAKDSIGRTVGYEYDAAGRLWKVTDARGGVTEYTYDIAHRMLTLEDPRGIVYLENEYDTSGRVIRQTQANGGEFEFAYTLDGSGKITQTDVTNPRGFVRRVAFNAGGYPTSDTAALGESVEQTTTYARLAGSNLVETETDPLGRVTHYTYDTHGNVTTITRLYGTADAVSTSYSYDPIYHLLTSTTDPLNHTSTIAYDGQGRLLSATNPLTHQTIFGTNTAGQVVSVTDPLAKTTIFGYALGDLVSVQTPLGHAQSRFVDNAGRLIRITDALGASTWFQYDGHDQVTKITDARGGETSFTYDGNGNLLTLTDARGKTTIWTYDEMDRAETRTDPLNRTESFAYDLNGNLTTWTDRKGQVTTYQYDGLDRQTFVGFGTTAGPIYASTIATTYDAGNRATDIVDSVGGTIERDYDLLDRLTEEVTPEGIVSYTYDAAGRRTSMTVAGQPQVTYTYDSADRLTEIEQGTATVTLAYDNASRRTSLTLPNGIVVEYGYDDDSRLTSLTYKQGTNTLGNLTYAYDAAGQRAEVGGTWARTNLPPALASATYDDANQIATWESTAFTYDDNGNLTSDGIRTYAWDARNQLVSVAGLVSASFGYDGVGRRRAKAVASSTTEFLYDGLNSVQELSSGNVVANILTGHGLDEYFVRSDPTGASNYVTDALGSTIALTSNAGVVQTDYTYEPFGAASTSGASSGNAFTFTGRETDGTGLYFYRARYYHPRLQRFISEDPIEFGGGDSNYYAYVSNAPTEWTDPTGLFPFLPPPHCRPKSGKTPSAWVLFLCRQVPPPLPLLAPGPLLPPIPPIVPRPRPTTPNPPSPKPPGWDEAWRRAPPEGLGKPGSDHWFDPDGGEWRHHQKDRHHPVPHWDYNPWREWNDRWRNIFPLDPKR